jgi:hypothetical protein
LRSVDICNSDPFAATAPATPDESTWVVDTGLGRLTAGSIELAKVKSLIALFCDSRMTAALFRAQQARL